MADCTDPKNQEFGGAFPGQQGTNTGAVQVNLNQDPNSIFNPNLALAAMQTYNTFNNVANQMFGIEARWFRAIPQQRSKDVIFQEYTLSCVEDTPLCIKVVVNAGNWPDSKYNYDLLGLEYDMPSEIQIDKKYWEENAGFGTAPQKKDIVYLVLPNKLYQVESSYLKRGFMEQETTWVINLKKYMPEASRREGPALQETIDKYTVSEAEIFGDAIAADIEKIVDDKQMSPFNSTTKDFYKQIDQDLKILPYSLDVQGIIAAQSFYNMSSMDPSIYTAVIYTNSADTISKTNDRSITAWIMPKTVNTKEYDVTSIIADFTMYPANYKITFKGAKNFNIGDIFIVYRLGSLNFYTKVISINPLALNEYYCKIDEDVETYLNTVNPNWATARNWKMKVQSPINIINGIKSDSSSGFKIDLYANQYIKITYGVQEYSIAMDSKLLDDNWYGIVVNIGNSWSQANVHVWKPSLSSIGDKLVSVYYKTISFTPADLDIAYYSIMKSDGYITNIRLFRTTIEDENQIFELLSYFTKNADQALILDNCDLKFYAPFLSRQR